MASAAPTAQSDGFFSNLARKIGFSTSSDTTAAASPPPSAKPKTSEAKRGEREQAPRPDTASPKATASKPTETRQAATRPPLKPSVTDGAPAVDARPAKDTLVAGSQPIVSTNSFDSRFGAVK